MPQRVVIPALHYHPIRPSGSVRLAYDQAVYMAQRGWEVWLIAQDEDGDQPEYAEHNGLRVLHYPAPRLSLFDPRRMGIHQKLARDLLARYVPQAVDLLHGHTLLSYDGALGYFGPGTRSAYSIHSPVKLEMQAGGRGASPIRRLKQTVTAYLTHRVEGRVLARSHTLTSDSDYTRQMIGKLHNPALGDRITVVPGWVDLDRFDIAPNRDALKTTLGWPLDVPVLFTLRRLVPRNGLDRLLAALKRVTDSGRDFRMFLGGAGPLRDELEALCVQLGLAERVRFLGRVPDETLPQMYAAADLFVLPTTALECFGLITLEAFAAGRPVVATPVGAIPEIVRPVEPGWLAADATPEALAGRIREFLDGTLPQHPPEDLRAFASRYERETLIQQLIQTALGEAGI